VLLVDGDGNYRMWIVCHCSVLIAFGGFGLPVLVLWWIRVAAVAVLSTNAPIGVVDDVLCFSLLSHIPAVLDRTHLFPMLAYCMRVDFIDPTRALGIWDRVDSRLPRHLRSLHVVDGQRIVDAQRISPYGLRAIYFTYRQSQRMALEQSPGTLGRRIAECRERKGWKQKDLAERAGISVAFLSEIENDRRGIGAQSLLDIADALGASLDYLQRGEVQPQPVRRSLVIPSELAEAADEKGWSTGHTMDLLRAREIVRARRSRGGDADRDANDLTKEEWVEFYKRLFR
jgi:transcriptional regulator with XRE-family HTH domain